MDLLRANVNSIKKFYPRSDTRSVREGDTFRQDANRSDPATGIKAYIIEGPQ